MIVLDGEPVEFLEGESLYQVALRHGRPIPSLCYDPRLEPFGGCRLCAVEVQGTTIHTTLPALVVSCTTRAVSGMLVRTRSPFLDLHRRTLLEMVASENPVLDVDPLRGLACQQLQSLVDEYGARTGRFQGRHSGEPARDDNPFILRDYTLCISCYRCVRICAEQQGDHALSVLNRGFETRIATAFEGRLKDSSCSFCGQCLQTCPTGALADRSALAHAGAPGETTRTRTVCGYCGVGCSVDVMARGDQIVGVLPALDGPVNHGALCVKGQFAFGYVQHPDRLTTPLVREDGRLRRASWDEALDRAAEGFRKAAAEHGRGAVYGIASGRTPNEACYLVGKFMRAGFGTHNVDHCARL